MLLPVAAAHAADRQQVPTAYEAGHFYAVPETAAGQRLRLLVDTGGGGGAGRYVITAAAARRLGLTTRACGSGADRTDVVASIAWRQGLGLPVAIHPLCEAVAIVSPGSGRDDGNDGVLGAGYLPGHIWTFDYPRRQLWLEPAAWSPTPEMRRVGLGFQLDSRGALGTGMPRIQVEIGGAPVDLLLDTGATARPTAAGARASGIPTAATGIGVTSYITTSMLEHWHHQHPEWRVVVDGDDLMMPARLIEVPEVRIAGWSVGPVWFTERPDRAFHEFMGSYMDRPIEGSLGGNALEHFVMTLDYPQRAAWFACAAACHADGGPMQTRRRLKGARNEIPAQHGPRA